MIYQNGFFWVVSNGLHDGQAPAKPNGWDDIPDNVDDDNSDVGMADPKGSKRIENYRRYTDFDYDNLPRMWWILICNQIGLWVCNLKKNVSNIMPNHPLDSFMFV